MISFASIDYFSAEGIPFVLIAVCNIWLFQPIVTFLHELGHGLMALLLTDGTVRIQVGEEGGSFRNKIIKFGKRFCIDISLKNTRAGYTQFEEQKKWVQLMILLAGPMFTLCLTCQSGYLLLSRYLPGWAELLLVSWFCANLLAFFRSVIPVYLKPTATFPEGPPSDGLQIINLLLTGSSHKKP